RRKKKALSTRRRREAEQSHRRQLLLRTSSNRQRERFVVLTFELRTQFKAAFEGDKFKRAASDWVGMLFGGVLTVNLAVDSCHKKSAAHLGSRLGLPNFDHCWKENLKNRILLLSLGFLLKGLLKLLEGQVKLLGHEGIGRMRFFGEFEHAFL